MRAREAIGSTDAEVYVSAATAWEVATKFRIGKLSIAPYFVADFELRLAEQGFRQLAITVKHGRAAGLLEGRHRDPFDRILAAQSLLEEMPLVSSNDSIKQFGVEALW